MELPDAKKWFTGWIDVTRWIKDFGTLGRLLVIAIVFFLLAVGAGKVKQIFFSRSLPPLPTISGGENNLDYSQQKTKNKIGIFNLW